MEAAIRQRAAAAVLDLDRALAVLEPLPSLVSGRRLFAAYLSIGSAKELLCDEREQRAVLLLQHARRVLAPLESELETGRAVTRHLEHALWSLEAATH